MILPTDVLPQTDMTIAQVSIILRSARPRSDMGKEIKRLGLCLYKELTGVLHGNPASQGPDYTLSCGLGFSQVRSKLAGYHFSQEALTQAERRMLYPAEALLRRLDELAGGYRHY